MALKGYNYSTDESLLVYSFTSIGPKGRVKKVVKFIRRESEQGESYYNLGLGDWNPTKQKYEDFTVTANEDTERVLMTVAAIVLDFIKYFDNLPIFVEGATKARSRLFQIYISKYKLNIESVFEVYGFVKGKGWEPFTLEKNYQSFLVRRK